jgi:hypothetical protein
MRIVKSVQTKVCVDGSLMKEYVLDEPLTTEFLKFLEMENILRNIQKVNQVRIVQVIFCKTGNRFKNLSIKVDSDILILGILTFNVASGPTKPSISSAVTFIM